MLEGKFLLAGLLGWDSRKIDAAIAEKDHYTPQRKQKRSGGTRTLYAPSDTLKEFQRRFLKYFLYRIPVDKNRLYGFVPKSSHIKNALSHANEHSKFVLRLDFKDAFPSVGADYLRQLFEKILFDELEYYTYKESTSIIEWILRRPYGRDYRGHTLFPVKRVWWFRTLIENHGPQMPLQFTDPLRTVKELAELATMLTTYRGKLPQGAPTSPQILNIVLTYSGLLKKIDGFLGDRKIIYKDTDDEFPPWSPCGNFSVYADDITISSAHPIKWADVRDLISLIEENSPFTVNREKILYYRKSRTAPLVTGIRLVTLKKTPDELGAYLDSVYGESLGAREVKNIKKKMLHGEGVWKIETVRYPKKLVRKVRGLIRKAIFADDTTLRDELRPKIEGYVSALRAADKNGELPKQVKVPYERFKRLTPTGNA